MSTTGLTTTLPEVEPPVAKFVPTQEVALVEDHVIVDVAGGTIDVGSAEIFAVGSGGGMTAHIVPFQAVPEVQSVATFV